MLNILPTIGARSIGFIGKTDLNMLVNCVFGIVVIG